MNRCKRTYFWEQKKWIGEWEKKTFELISLNLRSNRSSRDGALRGDWGTFQSTWNLWKCLSIALSLLMVFVWMETFFVGSVLFCSVLFLSDVGAKLLIVTHNIRNAITLGTVDILAYRLPSSRSISCSLHIDTQGISCFVHFYNQFRNQWDFKAKDAAAQSSKYILYLFIYSFDGYLARIVCSFAQWIVSKESIWPQNTHRERYTHTHIRSTQHW